jgi:hypothetical protein
LATAATVATDKPLARAQTVNGVLTFVRCEPTNEYETLGIVRLRVAMACDTDEWARKLTMKAREEYPTTEAVIIANDWETATAIRFW